MFKIHIVDASNRAIYHNVIEEHFRIRHDIYVGERGWVDLERSDGREVDQFDAETATYLLGITPKGRVVAGSRLVPSLEPHLLSDVFPHLAERGVPRAADIFEWTRVFVIPELRNPGSPCSAAGVVYCGILEFCLQQGIRQLSIVCEDYWFDRLASIGWHPKRLGPPYDHRGSKIVGLITSVTQTALSTTRQRYGIADTVLFPKT